MAKKQRVDDQFLAEMGLAGLNGKAKQKALDTVLNVVNISIGKQVIESMSEDQLGKFEDFVASDPEPEEVTQWLVDNVSDYEKIAEEEIRKLRDDTKSMVNKVMAK